MATRRFENACFISYPHRRNPDAQKVVEAFQRGLQEQLDHYVRLPVYRDEERLRGGDLFNLELAEQLCRSVCMILLFDPRYFDCDHPFCAREYKAMERLEARRRGLLPDELRTKGLIIPVVICADEALPGEVRGERNCFSFSDFLLRAADFKARKCVQELRNIAIAIYERWNVLRWHQAELAADCAGFEFPSEEDIRDWLQGVAGPPLRLPGR